MATRPHILFAGGGSLGNIYPGMAVAEQLCKRLPDAKITFIGDGRPIEQHTVRGAGYAYLSIPSQERPQRFVDSIRFVTDNAAGYCAARWVLKEQQVSLVVGLGGHASATLARAAHGRRTPFVLLEPDAVPSFSTRALAEKAEVVCLASEETSPYFSVTAPTLVTGVPGRPTCLSHRSNSRRDSDAKKRLVVLGGEAGASSLNEAMPVALSRTGLMGKGWCIVHQTGEGRLLDTIERYRRAEVDALVVTYIDQLADLLDETNLVVCRSSGCTLAEVALAGAPALVVPDSRLENDSQTANAQIAQRAGSCQMIDETNGGFIESLAQELISLGENSARREAMASAAMSTARPEAAVEIAEVCAEALGFSAKAPTARRLAA